MEAGRPVRRLLQPSRQERVVVWTRKVVIELERSGHVMDLF